MARSTWDPNFLAALMFAVAGLGLAVVAVTGGGPWYWWVIAVAFLVLAVVSWRQARRT